MTSRTYHILSHGLRGDLKQNGHETGEFTVDTIRKEIGYEPFCRKMPRDDFMRLEEYVLGFSDGYLLKDVDTQVLFSRIKYRNPDSFPKVLWIDRPIADCVIAIKMRMGQNPEWAGNLRMNKYYWDCDDHVGEMRRLGHHFDREIMTGCIETRQVGISIADVVVKFDEMVLDCDFLWDAVHRLGYRPDEYDYIDLEFRGKRKHTEMRRSSDEWRNLDELCKSLSRS